MNKIVLIHEIKCTGCALCVEMCPVNILYIDKGVCKVTDENLCDRLKGCEMICPASAIKITSSETMHTTDYRSETVALEERVIKRIS